LAATHGIWYVAVMKLGTVFADTNFHAWRDYTPLMSWVDGLWAAKKLSHLQYLSLARAFGIGYSTRKRDVVDVMRDELDAHIKEHLEREMQGLQRLPSRPFQEIERFVNLFSGPALWRRPMLVFVAPTNMGKSMLAEHTLTAVGDILGVRGYVEVTVEGDEHFDMSEFDHRKHAGVLLDGVGDALLLKKNREMLQGRPKVCKGGKSATMKYAYPFTLCRRAVVVTMDLSAANLGLFQTDHWLADSKNAILLKLTESAWETGRSSSGAVPIDRRAILSSWSVAELRTFLEGKDLSGPAAALHANGVNGSDLLETTAATLEQDLRMTPFAARKVAQARDAFLQSI